MTAKTICKTDALRVRPAPNGETCLTASRLSGLQYQGWSMGRVSQRGFTLVELLVVIGIMVVMMALMGPAFTAINRAGGATRMFYDISNLLDNARTYALANNTYVFVGFQETDVSIDASKTQQTGVGRVYTAAVASKDGTRGYDYFNSNIQTYWKNNYNKGARLLAVAPLRSYDNLHIAASLTPPTSGAMLRDTVATKQRIGATQSVTDTPFNWPLGTDLNTTNAPGKIYFDKVIMFDPTGIARIQASGQGDKINQYLEIGLQPTNGNVAPAAPSASNANQGNYCAIQVNGLTGTVHMFRP